MSLILIVSIGLRLVAVGWSIVLVRRARDWRLGALTLMVMLMAARQVWTLASDADSTALSLWSHPDEIPGLAVSVLALIGMVALDRMLAARDRDDAVRRAEAGRNRALVARDVDLMVELDASGKLLFASPQLATLLGYSGEELVDAEFATFLHPEGRGRAATELPQRLEADHDEPTVYRLRHRDGSSRWLELRSRPYQSPLGQPQLLITARDITERDHSAAALRESRERYHLLAEHGRDIVWTMDFERKINFVSPSVERILGFTPVEQRRRLGSLAMLTPASAERTRTLLGEAMREGRSELCFEAEHWTKSGKTLWCEVQIFLVRDENDRLTGALGVTRDISERKRAESEREQLENRLRHAQRMEAFGQLAGGVAHDFNNYLTVILGHAEQLREEGPAEPVLRESVEAILDAAERSALLTQQLLAFSRKQVMRPRVLDPGELVTGMQPLLQRALGEHIQLEIRRSSHGYADIDPGQLEQVVLNLALNARDAMPGGGRLTLETEDVELGDDDLPAGQEAPPGPTLRLTVRDTGQGMDEQTRARIFEPFFSTKREGHGTGLGLATVYGIVRQSHGHIEVESEPGRGTTFRIHLPRIEAAAAEAGPEERSTGSPEVASGTVLLVEDEAGVRSLVRRSLERNGYRVIEADGGQQALALAERHAGRIDLLLTDVVMPEPNGVELYARLSTVRPGLRVLYISGYAQAGGRDTPLEHHALLHKPFTQRELLGRVQEVLHAPPSAGSGRDRAPDRAASA